MKITAQIIFFIEASRPGFTTIGRNHLTATRQLTRKINQTNA